MLTFKKYLFYCIISVVGFTGCTQVVTAPISIAGSVVGTTLDVAGSAVGATVNAVSSSEDEEED